MLYAQTNRERWTDLPHQWDEVQDMFKYLNRMAWGYQLNIERRMFYSAIHPEFRCSLIRWAYIKDDGRRYVLLETTDPEQMKAALIMLISEVEAEYKATGQRVSMVP